MFNKSFALLGFLLFVGLVKSTPLDDYVNAPDPHFQYELIKTYPEQGYTVYVLNVTSQKWLDETIVVNPIWWHYLSVVIPDVIKRPDAAFMFIEGGNNDNDIPQPTDNFVQLISLFSVSTGTIGADLQQIPNQPTRFVKDPRQKNRYEDAVIAWTWKTFIENPNDANILLRLPMTKASVRAMDAIADFAKKKGVADIKKFMIAGASKRGWTTWTTAAVDKRVFGAMPIVMDMLSLNRNLHNHFRSLGGWTFAFNDYYEENITTQVDSFGIFAMQQVVDPYTYLDRYKNIKILAVTTGGDEFFLPDDTYAFWDDLIAATDGTALLRRLPNAEHSCAGHEISLFFSMRGFFLATYENKPLPVVRWARPNNRTHGIIEATVDLIKGPRPKDVRVFYAKTLDNKRRDFRLVIGDPSDPSKAIPHPVVWESSKKILSKTETSTSIVYRTTFLKPISGWLAFFIQLSFEGIENSVIEITTEANVIPETYPFDDCTLASCYGKLV